MNISNINGGDVEKEKTEPDIKMRTFNIKTPSPESKELQIAKNIITAEDFYDSERPKLNRTTSANNISCASVQQEGELTVRDRSISTSLQDIDFEKWDTDKKFKRYDSEESSMDYDNKEYFEEKKTTVVNNLIEEDSLKSNLIDEDRLKSNLFEEDKPKSNLFLEQKVVDDTIKGREANLVNDSVNLVKDSVNEQEHFEEQDVDWDEVNAILVEKRENKVYKCFQAKHLNKGQLTGFNPKRKLSPDEPDMPSKTLRTPDMVCASPKLRPHSYLTMTGPRSRSTSLSQGEVTKPKNRAFVKLRRRCNSVHNGTGLKKSDMSNQKLITDMLKLKMNGQSE